MTETWLLIPRSYEDEKPSGCSEADVWNAADATIDSCVRTIPRLSCQDAVNLCLSELRYVSSRNVHLESGFLPDRPSLELETVLNSPDRLKTIGFTALFECDVHNAQPLSISSHTC